MVERIVNFEKLKGVSIHEHFVSFLNVMDTTEKGLCKSLLGHLGLNIANCRGQSYDNQVTIRGKTRCSKKECL